jgi:D-sedoheptulose 7-phosphate isomerase
MLPSSYSRPGNQAMKNHSGLYHQAIVSRNIKEHIEVLNSLSSASHAAIIEAAVIIANSLSCGRTVFWCGNGGSAADCQHMAAELVGRFKKNRKPLRSIALTTDTSILTCIANDFGYEDLFSRQITALANEGDVLIAISTSGNSQNIVEALKVAQSLNVDTISFLGRDGGLCIKHTKLPIIVPSESTARVQEVHIMIGHILCDLIEKELGIG